MLINLTLPNAGAFAVGRDDLSAVLTRARLANITDAEAMVSEVGLAGKDKKQLEDEMLRLLFSKRQNIHPEFKQEIIICRQQYETFAEAVTYLKTVVSRLFLEVNKARSRRNISSIATREVNGVDISDLKRWYDSSEIKKLNESQAGRRVLDKIMGDKKRHQRHKDKIDRIKSSKRRRIKSASTSKPTDDGSALSTHEKRMVAAMITGMNNSSKHSSSISGRVIRTNKNSVSTDSAITFDHLGNPL